MFKVKIFEGADVKSLSVDKASFCVGSTKQSAVVLSDASIDAEHVRVWTEGGRLWIQDLGTTAGTTLNDMRLPPLKPMLCREIDTLKLGSSPFTLSIEPIFVRAPQVKAPEPSKAPPRSSEFENEAMNQRRDELASISRELADLRLHLQMARLEKEAVEEIKRFREGVQEQIKELEVKKSQMIHEIKEWEKDKVTFRRNLDSELADLRVKTLRDLQQTTEMETKKFENWRSRCVDDMNQLVVLLMGRKIKPLVGKTISAAQIKQLEGDITTIMRKVLLNETSTEENVVRDLYEYDPKAARRARAYWQNMAMTMMGAVTMFSLVLFGWKYMPKRTEGRTDGRAIASETKAKVERKIFSPSTTSDYKGSYTDNVLYTTKFAQTETNSDYRKLWILELNRVVVDEWNLGEDVIVALAAKELNLIQDLIKLRGNILPESDKEGIARLRARETVFQGELKSILKSKDLVSRFSKFKRSFYRKNQNFAVASAPEEK